MTIRFLLSTVALLSLIPSLQADNWPNWRGPFFNGSSAEKGLPTVFSKTQGVAWQTKLPGEGASTPIVWNNAVFVTSIDPENDAVQGMRIDAETGKIVWTKTLCKDTRIDERSTFAGPSALTDGKIVWFFTGTGDLWALNFDGEEIWHRNMEDEFGVFAMQWTFSSTPQLHDGTLYLQILQRDVPVNGRGRTDGPIDSFLLAMEPDTGQTKWKHVRKTDAVQESKEAYSTPIPILHDGRPEILILGADYITGHDPTDGKELWRWGSYNPEKIGHWRTVPSPVYGKGTILACGPKGSPVYALAAGGNGFLLDTDRRWTSEGKEVTSDVPTPLFYEGFFYILNERLKMLSCVEPMSGAIAWTKQLPAKVKLETSPTGADGKIYMMSHLGEVFVVSAGPSGGEILNATTFGQAQSVYIRASIVPANGTLYIRTDDTLYAVRK